MRLERLFERIGLLPPVALEFGGASPAIAALERIDRIAGRLRDITREVDTRTGVSDWDVGDTIVTRLLLSDMADALGACRTVTSTAAAQLIEVQSALRSGRRLLECETEREEQARERRVTR